MSIKQNLTNIASLVSLAVCVSCEPNIEQKTGIGVVVRTANGVEDSSKTFLSINNEGNIRDIDGDGKQDIMFELEFYNGSIGGHYIFYRKYLENGDFSEPIFLYKKRQIFGSTKGELPLEQIPMHNQSPRQKYLAGLVERVEYIAPK